MLWKLPQRRFLFLGMLQVFNFEKGGTAQLFEFLFRVLDTKLKSASWSCQEGNNSINIRFRVES
jgi:hypothetical protein